MLVRALVALAVLEVAACAGGPYRATWQPMTPQDVFPALVDYAISLEPSDVELVEAAGGSLIGYHATRKGYSPRAASVGGTHFVAVAGDVTAHTSCAAGLVGGVALGFCSTRAGYRPRRIAVYRVDAARWTALPPHLVPPTENVPEGVWAPVTRDGCRIGNAWGIVKCSNSWQLRSHVPLAPPEPAPMAPAPSSAPSAPEAEVEPAPPDVPTNPY